MRRIAAVALALVSVLAAGCGSGTGTDTGSRPVRLSYGPARSHPYWWASEVLLHEAREIQARFDALPPGNLRGQLNLIGKIEQLEAGCRYGYGISECRRGGEIYRIYRGMWRAIVPPPRRHVGFNTDLQISLLRYHQALADEGRGLRSRLLGLRTLRLAIEDHHGCKAIPTCPWQRAATVEHQLERELAPG